MLRKLNTKHAGFTLVEIMIVVAIIALLAAIAVPNFLRSRKRSQATMILEELRAISGAVDQYAIDTNRTSGFQLTAPDIQPYLKTGTRLSNDARFDPNGWYYGCLAPDGGPGIQAGFIVDGAPSFSVLTFNALSDVAPAAFWSPYGIQ